MEMAVGLVPGHDDGHPVPGGRRGLPGTHAPGTAAAALSLEGEVPPDDAGLGATGCRGRHAVRGTVAAQSGPGKPAHRAVESRPGAGRDLYPGGSRPRGKTQRCSAGSLPRLCRNGALPERALLHRQGPGGKPLLATGLHRPLARLVSRAGATRPVCQADHSLCRHQPAGAFRPRQPALCHGFPIHHGAGAAAVARGRVCSGRPVATLSPPASARLAGGRGFPLAAGAGGRQPDQQNH